MARGRTGKELIEAWVRLNTGPALAYAKSLLRDHHQAEDIVQDCFCRLLARSAQYDLISDGRKILFRSITNACINHGTRFRLVTGYGEEGSFFEENLGDSREPGPLDMLIGRETQERLRQILASLPLEQRAAVQMKSVGCSLEEIAKELAVTPNHAGVLVHRARKFVASQLGDPVEEKAI